VFNTFLFAADKNCSAEDSFACKSGPLCFPLSYRCDGNLDCSDGSDEAHCGNYHS